MLSDHPEHSCRITYNFTFTFTNKKYQLDTSTSCSPKLSISLLSNSYLPGHPDSIAQGGISQSPQYSIINLQQEETYTAYCKMWCSGFKFPLPVTSFTKKQCKSLQRVFTSPFLAKMGISRTTSWALVFAQYQYSGFSIANTWVQQGLQHLHFLLGH